MRKLVLAAVLVLMASGAQAATLDVSPDVAVELGGATVQQQDVARDDLSGGAPGSIADLGSLPDGADVVGYHEASPTQQLFVLDVNADLGGTYASAGDVIAYDPGAGLYQIELDMSALGIPDGARVDAFGLASNGDYILSFDVTVDLGGGLVASDEDLINYSLGGGFTMLLNGSNVGLDRSLNLDAASELDGNLLVSFDSHGSIGGIDFADEDVLSFDPVAGTWTAAYDGSAVHPGQWEGADLVAVPEPGAWSLMGAGMALLAGLARRKRNLALIAALLVPASAGMASDGVLEINQACAVNTGCFSGDTEIGFPVTIASAGSYRLTSNLNVSDEVNAIVVSANDVSIDLNGFSIKGNHSCSPQPGGSCPPGTTGSSASGISVSDLTAYFAISVKNGSIADFRGDGVRLGYQSEVTNLRVRWNSNDGISVGDGSKVLDNASYSNYHDGIRALPSSTVSNNKVYNNGNYGIHVNQGSAVSGNTTNLNGSDGMNITGASLVTGNTVKDNAGYGIRFGCVLHPVTGTQQCEGGVGVAAFSGNLISDNTLGTVVGVPLHAVELGPTSNLCDGVSTCTPIIP